MINKQHLFNRPWAVTEFDLAMLHLVSESRRPIGQGALNFLLRRQGVTVSPPTIGRRLRELEFAGVLRKISVEGRVITEHGRDVLKQWQAEARFRTSGDILLETLKRGDKKHLLELLATRRVIESEAAGLAAKRASSDMIRRMQKLLVQQADSVGRGGLGIAEDVAFHEEIARACGNEVLASLISVLRHNRRYNVLITSMRAVVGSRLVVDHQAILDGIKRYSPRAARDAMDRHLRSLADDLDRYWSRWVRRALEKGGRDGDQR